MILTILIFNRPQGDPLHFLLNPRTNEVIPSRLFSEYRIYPVVNRDILFYSVF